MPDTVDLLTAKPTLYVANVDDSGNPEAVEQLTAYARERGTECIAINAKIEAELAELSAEEAEAFLDDLGIDQPALDLISLAAYRLLDLIPFFTTGPKETRAWTIRRGQNAQRAAGRIHSDLERGFIRAEVVPTEQLLEAGSEVEAKKRGWVRVEGRDYVVVDGDVLNVRFNVYGEHLADAGVQGVGLVQRDRLGSLQPARLERPVVAGDGVDQLQERRLIEIGVGGGGVDHAHSRRAHGPAAGLRPRPRS